jgi:hypothetical protein
MMSLIFLILTKVHSRQSGNLISILALIASRIDIQYIFARLVTLFEIFHTFIAEIVDKIKITSRTFINTGITVILAHYE